MSARPRVYLLDASIYIFKAWFSMPDQWKARNGFSTQAVVGYTHTLLGLLEQFAPTAMLAAFDESLGTCFRHDLYAGYKSNRALPDEALAFQLNACRDITEALGVSSVAHARFEADDLIATAARLARERAMDVWVLSRDKDLGQLLLQPGDRLTDVPVTDPLDRKAYEQRHGIAPEQVAEWLALTGDSVDAIPGVPGIGAVTATRLLQRYGSLDSLMSQLDDLSASGIRGAKRHAATLQSHRDQIALALRLTTLENTVDGVPTDWRLKPVSRTALERLIDQLGLGAALVQRATRVLGARGQ